MQRLRPYVLPGLFLFHLMTLCVMVFTAGPIGDPANPLDTGVASAITVYSQFVLTALWAGWGSSPWVLRIPGWGAMAALNWLSFTLILKRIDPNFPRDGSEIWQFAVAPLVVWIVLVTLLLCLRVILSLRWHIALQPTTSGRTPGPRNDSLTRGMLIVVATWGGVLMLLKDSLPWSALETDQSGLPDSLLAIAGIAALVGAVLLAVAILAVSLTLTRLADRMFYRRRWTLPLLVTLVVGVAIALLMHFSRPLDDPIRVILSVLFLLLGLGVQPLTALLVMGMAGYRLAPQKQPTPVTSDASARTDQPAAAVPSGGWIQGLHQAHFVAPVALLVLFGGLVTTGIWNNHRITMVSRNITRNDAGEITSLTLSKWATDNTLRVTSELDNLVFLALSDSQVTDTGLVHLNQLTNLHFLDLGDTEITDAGLVNLKGLTKLTDLTLGETKTTDAGLVHLKGLTNLQRLYLDSTEITDVGLAHLMGLTNLHYLNIQATKVTDEGVAEFRQALPNCRVVDLIP